MPSRKEEAEKKNGEQKEMDVEQLIIKLGTKS